MDPNGIQELSFDEIEEVNGGRVNWRMVEEGGLLIGAGALAVATGSWSLVAVGGISLGLRLIHIQNATAAARLTAERKFLASLS